MREIIIAKSAECAFKTKKEKENSTYYAGGTEVNRLNSSVCSNSVLIDINSLPLKEIKKEGDKVSIGALSTFQDLIENKLVPEYLKKSAAFMASVAQRNTATIGGNVKLMRCDSFLLPCLLASGAEVEAYTKKGIQIIPIEEFIEKKRKCCLITRILVKDEEVFVARFARTTRSHAVLTIAESKDKVALAIKNSGLAVGKTATDALEKLEIKDDEYGSAEYKKYLAVSALKGGK